MKTSLAPFIVEAQTMSTATHEPYGQRKAREASRLFVNTLGVGLFSSTQESVGVIRAGYGIQPFYDARH